LHRISPQSKKALKVKVSELCDEPLLSISELFPELETLAISLENIIPDFKLHQLVRDHKNLQHIKMEGPFLDYSWTQCLSKGVQFLEMNPYETLLIRNHEPFVGFWPSVFTLTS